LKDIDDMREVIDTVARISNRELKVEMNVKMFAGRWGEHLK